MHPLRVLLLVSLVIAAAVAWSFGAALVHSGTEQPAAIVLAIAVFCAFLIPWSGVFYWAVRRASDLDELISRARAAVDDRSERSITDRAYHGELDELARAIEQLRSTIVRQREDHEETRTAMSEIVGSLGEGLLAVNAKGRVVFANSSVREMFGPAIDVAGRSVLEVVRKQPVAAAIGRALEGEASTDRITLGSDQGERQIELRAVPVASKGIAAVALFIDVTTTERLQRVRKEFLDDFSHEVRTPLAGLRSAAETLEQGGLSAEAEQQLRGVMQRQIARIERLVSDLSELNRIESGQLVLERQPVSLRAVLTDVSADLQGRHQGVVVTMAGDDVIASIDEARAQQIFSNLLDNAVRHGGRETIEIEIAREGAEALVRVSDQGPGIPPAEIDKIFHRFYRVDRSRSQPGSGLGLAIARHLALLQGGSIRAWNRPVRGATFEVRLPADLT